MMFTFLNVSRSYRGRISNMTLRCQRRRGAPVSCSRRSTKSSWTGRKEGEGEKTPAMYEPEMVSDWPKATDRGKRTRDQVFVTLRAGSDLRDDDDLQDFVAVAANGQIWSDNAMNY